MKKKALIAAVLISIAFLVVWLISGCAGEPNAVERTLFNVQTNFVVRVITVTNEIGVVVTQTNLVERLVFEPKEATVAGARVGGTLIGSPFGIGGLLAGLLAGAFSVYAKVRSGKINESLVQAVETAREVIKTTPQGQWLDREYRDWLIYNQATSGTISTIKDLVDKYSDNPAAKEAVKLIAPPDGGGDGTQQPITH